MSDLEVKSVSGLAGTGINYAYAIKAGPWIFMTGHEAFDFETGIPEAVAGPEGFPLWGLPRYRREGDFILKRMQGILEQFGSSLANGVRLDQYYPTPEAVDPYHLARRAIFGDYIPPSTSVIMERTLGSQTSICTSLIAVMPGEEYKISRVYPKDVAAPTWSGFVPAITCNDFIFVAGQMATAENEGLDPRAHVPDFAAWGGSEMRKQTEFLIQHKLKPALEAAGSSLENAVKAQIYLDTAENFPDFLDVWNQHFKDIPCAITVVPTKSFGSIGGINEINLLALTGTAKCRKQVVTADLPGMVSYGPCVRAGEFLFPSALMPIGKNGKVAGTELSPMFDSLSHAGSVQAQCVYAYAEALCAAAGASMKSLLRAQYFVSSTADFAGIAAAWSDRYGSQPHPFVCVQTPKLPAPGAVLTADFWIYAP